MIDLRAHTKEEIDTYHRLKRIKNLKVAMYFIYALIFMFVVSLSHSLVTARDNAYLEDSVKQLSEYVMELEVELEKKECMQQ